jgi:ABC-type lipoprotein export system ATPase subunit
LIVTHDSRIYDRGDRMIVMADGKVTATLEEKSMFAGHEQIGAT